MGLHSRAKYLVRAVIRENAFTDRRTTWLLANEHLPAKSINGIQARLLGASLQAGARRLPAYRHLRNHREEPFELVKKLPVISKDALLDPKLGYVPTSYIWRFAALRGLTSGTTGTPLQVYRSISSAIWESAFIQRHWHWSGFARGMRRATLRGDNVASARQANGPFWHYSRADNQLILSSRHLREPFIGEIVRELVEFRPYILQAYPSTAFELVLYLQRAKEQLEIPYVYTSSEVLYPHQRALIESVLNSRVMDHYGMAERVAFISQCELGSYHVNTDYSFVEIVDEKNNPTRSDGYLVGTTFHNSVMPLIRYRMTDQTRWKMGTCDCGRTYPTVEPLTGKLEDTIYGADGAPISPSVITFAFKGLRNIEKSQVAQVGAGQWEIRVVPMLGYGTAERSAIIENVRDLVDPKLDVRVVEKADIPRTEAGKYRWVVNEFDRSRSS